MAAGLGFKTFTTGEVLTAADVNGYLMQGILVFANAAARDAAITSPQEGQCCYLKDTDAVLTYSGSAWVGFDDSNAIQNSIINAKGDLISGSANDTPAILSVGSNGETLVADSSTSTGLRWSSQFLAGKNKLINGDFNIWQRGTSFAANVYNADRFILTSDASVTISRETFNPGAAPVAGYEGSFFCRMTKSAGGTFVTQQQRIEDVRTFAGQTVTLSFWARVASGTLTIEPYYEQAFGTGGSGTVGGAFSTATLTTTWTRYSFTLTLPSISGKTIGTSSSLYVYVMRYVGSAATTIDLWGVQLEAGSVATPFSTATGTLAGELAACQRYFYTTENGKTSSYTGFGGLWFYAFDTGQAFGGFSFPVTMRVAPTVTLYGQSSGTAGSIGLIGTGDITGVTAATITPNSIAKLSKTSGWSAGNQLAGNCTASAEL